MAIKELSALLSDLKPTLDPEEYVFCLLEKVPVTLHPLSVFQEEEGVSIICKKQDAELHKLEFEGIYKRITLAVYSSLEAVGLTAVVSKVLTEANISANVVAAYCHDHVFVPEARAVEALELIRGLDRTNL
ncbi:ACT domain-containing protein [Kangiella geojedonensis]|uniref:Transporter n=1 Tax=Kangiella geojedonensis TaxID=914150 RepID=A0A0F6TQP3_9GAMM|nr:ACT domain-containing protein [Kangiella geojedonensis]AKE52140.1 Transporter [Kangiella geojedonensis]